MLEANCPPLSSAKLMNARVDFVYKYKLLWDSTQFNTCFLCTVSSIYRLLFCIQCELNIITYYSFLTLLSHLCVTLSKYFPKCIIWALFVQFIIFLYASSSFIHNYFLFINCILLFLVSGQLNSFCLGSSLPLYRVMNVWSYSSTVPLVCMTWCLIKHQGNFRLLTCEKNSLCFLVSKSFRQREVNISTMLVVIAVI
jgi:hypothetical protein